MDVSRLLEEEARAQGGMTPRRNPDGLDPSDQWPRQSIRVPRGARRVREMMRRRTVDGSWFWSVLLVLPLVLAVAGTWSFLSFRASLHARGRDDLQPFLLAGYVLLLLASGLLTFLCCRRQRGLSVSLAHSETRVQQQDAMMHTVFDSVAEGVIVANAQGQLILFNPAANRLSGIGMVDAPSEQWSELYGMFYPDRVTPFPTDALPIVRAMRGELVDDLLVYVKNEKLPDGVFLNISGRPLRDDEGRFAGAAIVFRDVTEARAKEEAIRRLNLELAQSVAELSAVNRELEAFSYSVSHDLRAPLRHITGFVELLQQRLHGTLDETATRHFGLVGDAARQMSTLIDDLLAFSRMSRADMHQTTVDLGPLAHEVVAEVSREAGDRSLDWRIGALPVVYGDRAMLRVVLVNLLSNAVKYTRPRGTAVIEVGTHVPEPGLRARNPEPVRDTQPAASGAGRVQESGLAVLFVRDNGVGFDMQYANKLFGVFQRLHRPEEFEGTGVGLATVRRIIHRHGGRIWADSAPDAGATFYWSLPVRPATPRVD